MTSDHMLFGGFDPAEYAEEAEARWGGTEAHRQSARRTAGYSKEDWENMRREDGQINAAFLDLMAAGIAASDPAAAAAVDRHRAHISKWFYECTPEIHAGLGAMYTSDARFSDNIDRAGRGLARYLATAIAARYQT